MNKKYSSKGGKVKGKAMSRSSRAGLQFPVGRIYGLLRKGNYAERVGVGALVYLAAVMGYLAAKVLEFAGNMVRYNKKIRHLQLAVRNDEELNKLLSGVTITQGSVLPKNKIAVRMSILNSDQIVFSCSQCPPENRYSTDTINGLNIHIGKKHKNLTSTVLSVLLFNPEITKKEIKGKYCNNNKDKLR
ncbi:hypothetical protein RI129_004643 [Pyrocoelia pectoralis]|uniref:Histone H2A n=1 Tax=Pyrocoelia pectoralis TaxID=417401 RepID=A0AAN7VH28_9COLE